MLLKHGHKEVAKVLLGETDISGEKATKTEETKEIPQSPQIVASTNSTQNKNSDCVDAVTNHSTN